MKLLWVTLLGILLVVSGCTKNNSDAKKTSDSLPSESSSLVEDFIVWNGDLYLKTTDQLTDVDKHLATVNYKATDDQDEELDLAKVISNSEVGTIIYSLPGKTESEYIAVKNTSGGYNVYKNQGKYGAK